MDGVGLVLRVTEELRQDLGHTAPLWSDLLESAGDLPVPLQVARQVE
jgi:hypothetical protein